MADEFPKPCSHGVPLRGSPAPRCILCELAWHDEGLLHAKRDLDRHATAIAMLERELADGG